MNVSGEFTVKAPRERVFETIRDPKSFIALVDGLRDLKEIDPTHYEAVFETKIAYMKFRFNVSVEVTKLEVGEIGAKVEGTPLGVVGRQKQRTVGCKGETDHPRNFSQFPRHAPLVERNDVQCAETCFGHYGQQSPIGADGHRCRNPRLHDVGDGHPLDDR
jgi:hypothetical protein